MLFFLLEISSALWWFCLPVSLLIVNFNFICSSVYVFYASSVQFNNSVIFMLRIIYLLFCYHFFILESWKGGKISRISNVIYSIPHDMQNFLLVNNKFSFKNKCTLYYVIQLNHKMNMRW